MLVGITLYRSLWRSATLTSHHCHVVILSAFWPGPELAVRKVVNATAQNVLRLRHGFVKCAIVRVQVMLDGGNSEEAAAAVKELTQYYCWIRSDFSQDVQETLSRQLGDLQVMAENLRKDLSLRSESRDDNLQSSPFKQEC